VSYTDVDVDDPNSAAVAPLTPELPASLSRELRYYNARPNTGDYVLVMLSNNASEFGLRFVKEF